MKKFFMCMLATLGLTTACAQQNFENVDVQGFATLLTDTSVVVLDVRTSSEYAEGHYCRSGRRSANAASRLAEVGYKCVNLKGGIMAWQAANMPITKE